MNKESEDHLVVGQRRDLSEQPSIGLSAAARLSSGGRVRFPPLPQTGLFRLCRQPIYLGFAMTLWTGPVWTPDRLLLATIWSAYCVIGPLRKEQRFARIHGEAFTTYQRRVPYMLPVRWRDAERAGSRLALGAARVTRLRA